MNREKETGSGLGRKVTEHVLHTGSTWSKRSSCAANGDPKTKNHDKHSCETSTLCSSHLLRVTTQPDHKMYKLPHQNQDTNNITHTNVLCCKKQILWEDMHRHARVKNVRSSNWRKCVLKTCNIKTTHVCSKHAEIHQQRYKSKSAMKMPKSWIWRMMLSLQKYWR